MSAEEYSEGYRLKFDTGTHMRSDDDEPMVMRGFVKHPPREIDPDHAPNLIITEMDVIDQKAHWAAILTREADTPVPAIESIILTHEAGLYPPLDAMDWLVSALKKWHESGGQLSMDAAMKLKAPGKSGNAMKEAIQEQLKSQVRFEMFELRTVFGITNRDAAGMIEARLAETRWNETPHKLRTYSAETLVDYYERQWAKDFNEQYMNAERHALNNETDEEKRKRLTHYPRHSFEHLPQMKAYL